MWKSAIVMALIVSRLADAASAVDELALDPRTDTGVSSRGAHVGLLADVRPDGTPTWLQHGTASVASDRQTRSPRGDAMRLSALQHVDTPLSSASARCA
ncbi:MAG: hypothetical protein WBN68_20770 [Sedimenticolaceae bacterium]